MELRVFISVEMAGEQEVFVAQCLEHDIAAQGDSLEEAQRSFERTLFGQILVDQESGRAPLAGLKPAPSWYFTWYRSTAYPGLRAVFLTAPDGRGDGAAPDSTWRFLGA